MADNPSLKPRLPEALAGGYELALLAAQRETGLDRSAFPPENPWSMDQLFASEFFPQ